MGFLANLKVRTRILAVVILPMLGLTGFGGYVVLQQNAIVDEAAAIGRLVDVAPTISNLVHELQKERGRSAGFIGSGGEAAYAGALQQQQAATDAMLSTYRSAIDAVADDGGLSAHLAESDRALEELASVRAAVAANETDVATMAGYYGGTIATLFELIEGIGKQSRDGPLTEALVSYVAFLHGKEFAGQERAMGSNAFAAGAFTADVYQRFVQLIGKQNALFTMFAHHAGPEFAEAFQSFQDGAVNRELERMRAVGLAGGLGEDMSSVTGGAWFDAATKRIDELKAIEDRIGESLRARVAGMQAAAEADLILGLGVVLGLVAVTTLLVLAGIRSITRPVAQLTGAMSLLAGGDNTVEVPATAHRDEIGEMARAVEAFKRNAVELDAMRTRQVEIDEQARIDRQRNREALAAGFESKVGSVIATLTAAAGQMQDSARSMSSTASQTNELAVAVAAASEEASTNVQTVATATEQLAMSVSEIAGLVTQSQNIAGNAVGQARHTNEQVRGLVVAVQKISEVVELISAIAEQTNLLALNATIEAARAGEAGKGFAVVASEVKSLATQTARATSQISEQIGAVQAATTEAATAIEAIGGVIEEMSGIASHVAAAVEEQDSATAEITRSVREAAVGTQEVNTNISGVGDAAGLTGQAAGEVLAAAESLSGETRRLEGEVADFLAGVRAA